MKRRALTLGELLLALLLLVLIWAGGVFIYDHFRGNKTSIQEQEQNHPFAP